VTLARAAPSQPGDKRQNFPEHPPRHHDLGQVKRNVVAVADHLGADAKPYECGAPEALAFELYPMERARGMAIEAPAVRP